MFALLATLTVLLSVIGISVRGQRPTLPMPPPMPKSWPPTDEASPIPDTFLQDQLVTSALAYVQAVVPGNYLNIPPSKYTSSCVAAYPQNAAVPNCYWPNDQCVRANDTAAFKADVVTCPGENVWGLTYDDGPSVKVVNGKNVNDTIALRTALAALNNQKATFFIVGAMGASHPEEIQQTYAAGHQIAAHTWTHWTSTALSNAQFVAELKYTEALIYNATGVIPRYWRPPCGDVDDRIRAIADALGYRTILWSTSPDRDSTDANVDDHSASSTQKLLEIVKTWFVGQPGFISLEHDISTFTSGLAIQILDAIKQMGPGFPLKMMPIGTCMNEPFYRSNDATSTVPTPTATTASVSTNSLGSAAVPPTVPARSGSRSLFTSDSSAVSKAMLTALAAVLLLYL
ncbi:hypothetical protein SpCBS45565_g05170 [Spizellomyces sp. 'palustris']|nr:hypothetical protein SpCBS45565_g05170 [Spizellomyces sp. 'palustris']